MWHISIWDLPFLEYVIRYKEHKNKQLKFYTFVNKMYSVLYTYFIDKWQGKELPGKYNLLGMEY